MKWLPIARLKVGALALVWLAAGLPAEAANPPVRPNILFILMDDMGWTDAAVLGSDFHETPSIDRLRHEGMLFTDAYANAPNCSPSRASLMTGLYPPRHGILTVGSSERGPAEKRRLVPTPNLDVLAPRFVTVAEVLRAGGYATFIGGKWNLGDGDAAPEAQGFDVNVGGNASGKTDSYFAPWGNPQLKPAPPGTHLCDYVTDRAIEFIRERRPRPFFAYVAYYDVHTPLEAKPELVAKYRAKLNRLAAEGRSPQHNVPVYAAMVENADMNIGRLLAALNELGVADDTLVVLFSDNGGYGEATSMRPLRGSKGMLYEGGIRVPLIVRWPGRVAPRSTSSEPVIGSDFSPTFLAASGVPRPAGVAIDGADLTPLLAGKILPTPRPTLFWHCPVYLESRPQKTSDDSHDGFWRNAPSGAVRAGDWKLIEYFEDDSCELFNLREDIGEQKNLASAQPEKVRALRTMLEAWRTETGASVPKERNPAFRP